jgi:CelD/BcsL family acetyltransferase involved in cellulose biosynthesis
MTTETLNSLEGLRNLVPEWLELYRECPRATPFQSPQWLIPWTAHLFRGGEIQALAMREAGRLIGFAPLFSWGIAERTVSFLGAGVSDYGDILFAPGRERECAATFRCRLTERKQNGDLLDLQEIRSGSALLDGLTASLWSVCPVLDLKTYPDTMDPRLSTDLRRAQNKLSHSGLQFEIANHANFTRCLQDFFGLHERRRGPLESARRVFLEGAAVEFLAAGLLRLAVLRVDGVAAASIYAFTTRSTLYCYLSGFDPALSNVSPGAILLRWLLDQAVAEGFLEADFLRHPEPFKYLWGAKDRINYVLRLGPCEGWL